MRLPATTCLQRGLLSLRANWELVFASWLQIVATVALTITGLLPLLLLLGADAWQVFALRRAEWSALSAERGAEWLAQALDRPGKFAAALGGAVVLWFAAALVYCFFQAGLFGTLMAGDRQSPPGAPHDWRGFRTFRARDFAGWGRRYTWRYFCLANVFFTLYLLGALVLLGLVVLAVWAGERWGLPAAVGVGCGGALPLVFFAVVLFLWSKLAAADAAREESGVWRAMSGSLPLLGRRLGALTLFFLILTFTWLASGAVFLPVSIGLEVALESRQVARLGGDAILTSVRWLWNGVVSVVFGATLVSLMRSETAGATG